MTEHDSLLVMRTTRGVLPGSNCYHRRHRRNSAADAPADGMFGDGGLAGLVAAGATLGPGLAGQLTSVAACRTAASMSLGLTSSSLAICFSAFSPALSTACSILLSPTTTSAAVPSSMTSPNSLTSARDMPRHKWPPTPPMPAPTATLAMIEGGNKMPTTAPAAAPPQAPCRVAISSLLTCTLPS